MPNTIPEGVQSYVTPPPMAYGPPPPPPVGSRAFLTVVSIILGTVLSAGTIVAVLGRAFYVERGEYTTRNIAEAAEQAVVNETLKSINKSLASLELGLSKLSDKVDKMSEARDSDDRRRGRNR